MATKTISLELDAYEKLKRAKQGGESFSSVVRRARFYSVGGEVGEPRAAYPGAGKAEKGGDYWDRIEEKERPTVALESFDAASARQEARNGTWEKRGGSVGPSRDRGWLREDLYEERLPER